jgi:hypothetical protein
MELAGLEPATSWVRSKRPARARKNRAPGPTVFEGGPCASPCASPFLVPAISGGVMRHKSGHQCHSWLPRKSCLETAYDSGGGGIRTLEAPNDA